MIRTRGTVTVTENIFLESQPESQIQFAGGLLSQSLRHRATPMVETIGCHPKGVKPPWGVPF